MNALNAQGPRGQIQELTISEVDEVGGGIPLLLAGYIAIHGARIAYSAGVAAGAGITLYAIFDD